jgi:membrane protease YdiL (CAAX protease family)
MDSLISSTLFAGVCLVFALLASSADRRITAAFAVAAALYLGLDDFITGLPNLIPSLDFIGGNWNWVGKILSVAFSIAVIVILKISPDALGLRLKQEYPTLAWLSLIAFVIWGAALGAIFKPGAAGTETLLFQATMPGLVEEIAYRGVAPALLLGLVNRQPHVRGVPWSVVVATAFMFGAWHALSFSNGSVNFELMSGLFPMIGSIAGGWLRFKTKSLLVPILGHSLANVAFHVAGGLGA